MPPPLETIERINTLVASFDECCISFFDGSRLVTIGDWDLGYHHNFEAEFGQVSYIQCPTYFNAQAFRLAISSEREQLKLTNYTEEHDILFVSSQTAINSLSPLKPSNFARDLCFITSRVSKFTQAAASPTFCSNTPLVPISVAKSLRSHVSALPSPFR